MLDVVRAVMTDEPDGHPQFFHAPLRFALELLGASSRWRKAKAVGLLSESLP